MTISELERSHWLLHAGLAIFSDGDGQQTEVSISHDYDRQAAAWI